MALLAQLRDQGLTLRATGSRLCVEPRSALTDSLRDAIRNNKTAILRQLQDEAAEARDVRQTRVEEELRAHPEKLRAFDVSDAPFRADADAPISVVLAVRYGAHILSGELLIPRERWDMKLFLSTVDPGSEWPS